MVHQGGDIVTDAFNSSDSTDTEGKWKNIEVRYKGAITNESAWMNTIPAVGKTWATDFKPGDELKIEFPKLDSDDTIAVVYTPLGDILQRVKVA